MLITALLTTLLLPSAPPLSVDLARSASVSYATSDRLDWERPRFVLRAGIFGGGIVRGHAAVFGPAPTAQDAQGNELTQPGGSFGLGVRIPVGALSISVEANAIMVVDTFAPDRDGVGAVMGGAVFDFELPLGLGSERVFLGAGLDAGWGGEPESGGQIMLMPLAVTGVRAAVSASMLVSANVRVGWLRGLGPNADPAGTPNVTAEFGLEL